MFGVNRVTVVGRVVTPPVNVQRHDWDFHAFKIEASYEERHLVVWCYVFAGINKDRSIGFKIREGEHVLFIGSIFSPTQKMLELVGEKDWSLALCGRVHLVMKCDNVRATGLHGSTSTFMVTGMISPGICTYMSKRDKEYYRFTLHNETEIWFKRKIVRNRHALACYMLAIKPMKKVIIPGNVVLCTGSLDYGATRVFRLHCTQIESFGRVENQLLKRYQAKDDKFPDGYDPWQPVYARAHQLKEEEDGGEMDPEGPHQEGSTDGNGEGGGEVDQRILLESAEHAGETQMRAAEDSREDAQG